MIKICKNCENEFKAQRTTQTYCSRECQWAGLRRVDERHCLECGASFKCKPANPAKFCSRSCSATHNNKENPRRQPTNTCKHTGCASKIPCNYVYCKEHRNTRNGRYTWDYFFKWKNELVACPTTVILPPALRLMLIEEAGFSCSECGFSEPHPIDGSSILEIDHVNGNGADHTYNNLRVLCPNHHTMTETYRSRNTGNGSKGYYYSKILTKHK